MAKPDWTLGGGGGRTAEADTFRAGNGILGDGGLASNETPRLPGIADPDLATMIHRGGAFLRTRTPDTDGDWRFATFDLSDDIRILAPTAGEGSHTTTPDAGVPGVGASAPALKITDAHVDVAIIPVAENRIATLGARAAAVTDSGRLNTVQALSPPSPIYLRERLQ